MLFRRRRADRWPVDGSSPRACRVRTCNARTHRPSSANLLAGPPSQSEPFIIPPPARRRGSDIQAAWLGWLKVPCGNTPTTAKAPEEVGERIGGETHAFAEGRTRVPPIPRPAPGSPSSSRLVPASALARPHVMEALWKQASRLKEQVARQVSTRAPQLTVSWTSIQSHSERCATGNSDSTRRVYRLLRISAAWMRLWQGHTAPASGRLRRISQLYVGRASL
jgi:hypothetical protein